MTKYLKSEQWKSRLRRIFTDFTVFTQFFDRYSWLLEKLWRFWKNDLSKVPSQFNFKSKKLLDETFGQGFLYEKVFTEKKKEKKSEMMVVQVRPSSLRSSDKILVMNVLSFKEMMTHFFSIKRFWAKLQCNIIYYYLNTVYVFYGYLYNFWWVIIIY